MPTKLLIVESPGKVKKLSQILGSDWIVRASMGHVRELANDGIDSLGFDLGENTVRCRFIPRGSWGKATISQLKAVAQKVKTVVLETGDVSSAIRVRVRESETIAGAAQEN